VLSRETHAKGVYHLDVAAMLLAAPARQIKELADLVGRAALSPTDRRYLDFDEAFAHAFVDQHRGELRTLERARQVLLTLPRGQLAVLPAEFLDAHGAHSAAGVG